MYKNSKNIVKVPTGVNLDHAGRGIKATSSKPSLLSVRTRLQTPLSNFVIKKHSSNLVFKSFQQNFDLDERRLVTISSCENLIRTSKSQFDVRGLSPILSNLEQNSISTKFSHHKFKAWYLLRYPKNTPKDQQTTSFRLFGSSRRQLTSSSTLLFNRSKNVVNKIYISDK